MSANRGDREMALQPEVVSALAAVLGTLVGGSATVATAWITQRTLSRRERIRADIQTRELLYTQFIEECTRVAVDAYMHTLDRPDSVLPLFALLSRIRLTASEEVLASAEKTVKRITEQYLAPNLSIEQLRDLARAAPANPLDAFSDACRSELGRLRNQV
jgi:hypothetical protein